MVAIQHSAKLQVFLAVKDAYNTTAIFSNKLVHGINVFLSREKQRSFKSVVLLNNAFKNVSVVIFGVFKSN